MSARGFTENFTEEKELFSRIATRDEMAFKWIFEQYRSKLFNFTLKICKSEEVAEEIIHDVFLKLWTSRDLLHGIENPLSFLFTIAKNKSLDHLRKVARDAKLMDGLWLTIQNDRDPIQEMMEAKESYQIVNKAIGLLTPQQRLIWTLSREEGLSHEQIAQQLEISKNTVNNHLVASIKQIKAYLHKHNVEALLFLILLDTFID